MQPIILRRTLDIAAPPVSSDALMRAIADELKRHGSTIRRVGPDGMEFRGPSLFYFGFSMQRKAAGMVREGAVWIDPSAGGRLGVELRISVLQFIWPIAFLCVLMAAEDLTAGLRLGALCAVAAVMWFNVALARSAFHGWIRAGARRAALAPVGRTVP